MIEVNKIYNQNCLDGLKLVDNGSINLHFHSPPYADIKNYEKNVRNSWVAEELRQSRNFKAGFEKGLWFGLAHGGIIMNLTKGKEPWTWRHTKKDCDSTVPKS